MADILLTHGYFLGEDEKEQRIMKPYPPLGLLCLAAYLRREGFAVEVFDSTFARREDLYARLARERGVLGIYANLTLRAATVDILARARAAGWTTVAGGPEPAGYPDEYLAHGADAVVAGEGEATLAELLPALSARGAHRLHGIAGVSFRDESGARVDNPPRPMLDIEALPWPDRRAVDLRPYLDAWRGRHGEASLNLVTARGCPFRCRWCSRSVFGQTHRRRRPADCADELQSIVEAFHPEQVWYADDVFTLHGRWVLEYAAELGRRRLKVPFETITRADCLGADDLLAALAGMGCRRLWLGSESGSQRLLDTMGRGVSTEQIRGAVRAARRHGIETGLFVMWGFDGETEDDIAATVEHLRSALPDVFFTTVVHPMKNTPFYADVRDRLVSRGEWAATTDRDLAIRGRHSRRYYQCADRWLRAGVEAQRLRDADPPRAAELEAEARRAREELRAAAAEVEA